MDTKSKKFKYSRVKRILIAFFALLFTTLFILNLVDFSSLYSNFNIRLDFQDLTESYSVYDSWEFRSKLYNDLDSMLYTLDSDSRQAKYEKKYTKICNEIKELYNEGCTISDNFEKDKEQFAEDSGIYWQFADTDLADVVEDFDDYALIYQEIKDEGLENQFWSDVLNEYISDNCKKFYNTYVNSDTEAFEAFLYYDGSVYVNIFFDNDDLEDDIIPLYLNESTNIDEYLNSIDSRISDYLSNVYSLQTIEEIEENLSEIKTMKFYAEDANGKIITNCEDEKDILSIINNTNSDYYIYYTGNDDSKLTKVFKESDYSSYGQYPFCAYNNMPYYTSDMISSCIQDYYKNESSESGKDIKFIFAFYVSPFYYNDDEYGQIIEGYDHLRSNLTFMFEYPGTYLVYMFVSAVALIILFIITLKMAGHKGDGMVRTKIDVIPWPVHLILSLAIVALLITSLVLLIIGISESSYNSSGEYQQNFYSGILPYILAVLAAYAALLVFDETFVSIARKIKVKNRFHKKIDTAKLKAATVKSGKTIKSLSVSFGRLIKKAFRAFGIWLRKVSRAFVKKFKKTALKLYKFTFEHKHISTRSLLLLLLLLIVSDLFMALGITTILFGSVFFVLLGIVLILLSVACFAFLIWSIFNFINQFDSIVDTIENKAEMAENTEKLPESLKILSDYYTENEKNLKEAIAEAIKSEQMKAELITNVSHDLKTPLTSVINYADLLNGLDIADETEKKYVSVIYDKSIRLKKLIEDLIEVSKVSTGNVSIHKVVLNLNELTEQAETDESNDLDKYNLELIFNDPENNVTVWADGEKIYRVYQNLFSNVKKYSAPGTRVYASIYSDENYGYFELKNISKTPLNITPEKLFERFTRADKSRSEEGNGLGLSIAKELCNLNDGELILKIDGDLFKATIKLPKYTKYSDIEE